MSHTGRSSAHLSRSISLVRRLNTSQRTLYQGQGPSPSTSEWQDKLRQAADRLRLWTQLNRAALQQRTQALSSNASSSLHIVGVKLNTVTGYNEIEALKKRVVEIERRIADHRKAAKDAKLAYELAVAGRSSCQREVNDLLQRKSSWTEGDVTRFTSLVRQDHVNEQTEAAAKLRLAQTEDGVEREFDELMRAILNRYHEEQIWSDKIRSASTYGSILALGLNVVVFVLAIVLVEPYKRKRLAQTFEKRIEEIQKENAAMIQGGMASLTGHFDKQEAVLSQLAAVALQPSLAAAVSPLPSSGPEPFGEEEPKLRSPWVARSQERGYMKVVGSVLVGSIVAAAYAILGRS